MYDETTIEFLTEGGMGILPTDTLYGLVTTALDPDAVERVYSIKQRNPSKPLIVLISDLEQVEQFGIVLDDALIEQLTSYWPACAELVAAGRPGPYSIVLPTVDDQYEYLSRGGDAIAFRLPDNEELRELIRIVGPLVAPSANPEGYPPATTLDEAQKYFGSDVDFYVDGGTLDGKPSTLIRIENGEVEVIRD